jgi:4-amino-4-deoxy-L-arabinose transferase-like glycosyltransferase
MQPEGRVAPRLALAIFAAALAVRLVNILFLPDGAAGHFLEDSQGYWDEAAIMNDHGWLYWWDSIGNALPERRPPLYMYFLAVSRALFGPSPATAAALQAAVDAGSCVLIALLAARIDATTARWSGALAAVWPALVIHSALIVSDSLFLFLFLLAISLGLRAADTGRAGYAAASGLASGFAVVTRNVIQFLYPLAILVILAALWRRGRRHAVVSALAFAIAAAALPGVIIQRNIAHFDTPALTSQTGAHVLNWVLPEVRFLANGTPPGDSRAENNRILEERLAARPETDEPVSSFTLDRMMRDIAGEQMRELPFGAYLKAWLVGAATNLAAPPIISDPRVRALPKPSFAETAGDDAMDRIELYLDKSDGAYLASLLFGLAFAALTGAAQIWGAVRLLRTRPWIALACLALIAYVLAVTGPVIGPKYRLPAEPALIVFAAVGLADLARRLTLRRGRA